MKYIGENAIKKLISLIKGDLAKKQDSITVYGLLKGDGTTINAAVAEMDYMTPPTGGITGQVLKKTETGTEWADAPQTVTIPETTALLKGDGAGGVAAVTTDATPTQGSTNPVQSGGVYSALTNKLDKPTNNATATAGQLLTKTANGQEWQDREKDLFIVTISGDSDTGYTADKTFAEIKAAHDGGKTVVARFTKYNPALMYTPLSYLADNGILFTGMFFEGIVFTLVLLMNNDNSIEEYESAIQPAITVRGLLKSDSGGISAAVAGTDYVAPNGDGSNVTAAFTAASTRANIATGEKLSVLFGKIAKWFADLGSLAFKSTVAKSDLSSDVQASLIRADNALQYVSKSDVGLSNVANERQYSSANPPPYPVTSVNGKTGAVTVETSSGTTYNATLTTSGWSASGSYQKQTVTVTGLKANYPVAPVVDAQLTGTDADGDTAVLTGFSAINLIQTAADQLIAYCIGDAPTVNIPLIINTWG